jgi:uncharacterized protein (TIGR00251 family)
MRIQVKVRPNSKTDEIGREGDGFAVRVKDTAREGRANQAVIRLLAEHFGVPKRQVTILSGLRSENKVIEIAKE